MVYKSNSRRSLYILEQLDHFTFYNGDRNSNSGTNFSITCGKYSIKHYQILQARSEYLKYQT